MCVLCVQFSMHARKTYRVRTYARELLSIFLINTHFLLLALLRDRVKERSKSEVGWGRQVYARLKLCFIPYLYLQRRHVFSILSHAIRVLDRSGGFFKQRAQNQGNNAIMIAITGTVNKYGAVVYWSLHWNERQWCGVGSLTKYTNGNLMIYYILKRRKIV